MTALEQAIAKTVANGLMGAGYQDAADYVLSDWMAGAISRAIGQIVPCTGAVSMTQASEMPKFKPCPFCGGDDIRQEYGAGSKPPYNDPYVVCVDCGASVEGKSGTWNRRADLPPTPAAAMLCPEVMALVEAMRNAIEAIDAAYDGPDDDGRYSTRERSALSALEQAVRHE